MIMAHFNRKLTPDFPWGDYRHTLVRTATGWKVSAMSLSVTYSQGNERARDFVPQG